MSAKYVLLVNTGSLLMEGVEGLLESSSNGEYEVVSSKASNSQDLIREIENLNPTAVLLENLTAFISPAGLICALENISNIRVIVLDSQISRIEIYHKSGLVISHSDGFIKALLDQAGLA